MGYLQNITILFALKCNKMTTNQISASTLYILPYCNDASNCEIREKKAKKISCEDLTSSTATQKL